MNSQHFTRPLDRQARHLSRVLFWIVPAIWFVLPSAAEPVSTDPALTTIRLPNSDHTITFDSQSGRIVSLRSQAAPGLEFIADDTNLPVFVLQYLEGDKYRQISSSDAGHREIVTNYVTAHEEQAVVTQVTMKFTDFAIKGLAVEAVFSAGADDRFTRCTLAIDNDSDTQLSDVQFPFVLTPRNLGPGHSDRILYPYGVGQLITNPSKAPLAPDVPSSWQFASVDSGTDHYPGLVTAQFLSRYSDESGIYMACNDNTGAIKIIRPAVGQKGIRLGFAHVGDWPTNGRRQLGYDVVITTFTGDWHDAAEIYRHWSLQQPWAQSPLHKRADLPDWLINSPPHVVVRLQGEIDEGPVELNEEFAPLEKTIPMLERVSSQVNSPVLPVVMCWERTGPWVYPDVFPPVGGADAFKRFTDRAHANDWHVGVYGNGTRWVTGHKRTDYDGTQYAKDNHGFDCMCRTITGEPWRDRWDEEWRASYRTCMAADETRAVAMQWTKSLSELGVDYVQYFDQNISAVAYPCFSSDHGHPPRPGRWMTTTTTDLIDSLDRIKSSSGEPITYSVEFPPNEFQLPRFPVCDVRACPPGHELHGEWFFPLYQYLYHEFILFNAPFGRGPEPFTFPTRTSYGFVVGHIGGGVLTGDGSLLDRDTINWAPWEPKIGDDQANIEVLRRTTALRKAEGKPFVVFGRMMKPPTRFECQVVTWEWEGTQNETPAVYHTLWQSPTGELGLALANWTKKPQTVSFEDHRLGERVTVVVSDAETTQQTHAVEQGSLHLSLPPLTCAIVKYAGD